MPSIENYGVQMTFDNANFEKKLTETIKSLDGLKKSLDFANSKKSIEDLGRTTKGFDMSGMTSAIENVSGRFLAMSTIAITALSQITSRAISAGTQLVKSLSLDQVISGFQEYELNMNSIQTILANTSSKGSTLEDVNSALDTLNTYADQTIYNFAEMSRNIGTFTAAGVDLDTSVNAIKGIANLAAISGSNSQQASTAMYQLSQAISTGQVRLQDWNSVVNAGLGGEVFQKALFETGKAMGTIADVPIDQTFEQWTDAGNTFRGSLEQNWITGEVLTNTLQGFTGDLTEAQLSAIGYTQEQAEEIMKMGEIGKDAATKVKTLTQLIDTTKEAVASGWSSSFRIVFGDFEEARTLFSGVAESIGTMVGASADARNELLQGWKDLGGRALLIQALKNAFYALGRVFSTIKEAFREIFPKQTAEGLFELTQAFASFAQALIPSKEELETIKRIFTGFFAAIEIGWTIVKETINLFKDLASSLFGAGDGIGSYLANVGDFLTGLNEALVDGGGIKDFFDGLREVLKDPLGFLEDFGEGVANLFSGFDTGALGVVGAGIDRLGARFEGLKGTLDKLKDIWEPFGNALSKVTDLLSDIWNHIKEWFSELGSNIAETFEEGDFDKVVDLVNVGLLGGIAAILAAFFKKGLKLDFGGGLFDSITDTFQELTGVLSAMQTDIKANALLKIAGAVALLTASVLVLSLIDSAALTKALTAMAVGFAQLMSAFAILTKLTAGPKGAASLVVMSIGIIALAGAILLLSVAMAILATLDWNELAIGLTAVTVLLGAVTTASILLNKYSGSMVRAGIGIGFIAGAMLLLALAMKIFATLSWEEMAKGLISTAVGLGVIVAAMNLLPKGMAVKAAGILLIGAALNLLASAMKIIATMSWEEIGKGLVGIAGGLIAIALAMQLMPLTLPITAAGLVLVGVALGLIGGAMKLFATMSWDEIGRGLAAMAGALLVLAAATYAMSGTLLGAIAIGILALALGTLFKVLTDFSKIKISELLKGLLAIGIALGALALAALLLQPAIGALFLLGAALLVLGAGFALFGIGAALTAKAFEILAKAGKAGVEVLIAVMDAVIERIPDMIAAFAEGLVELALIFLEAAPVLLDALQEVFAQLLTTIVELTPQIVETLVVIIGELLAAIRELFPDVVQTGLDMLLALLSGIADNMAEIVTAAGDIIVEFLKGLSDVYPDVIAAGTELITNIITGIGDAALDIVAAGAAAIVSFLEGVASNVLMVIEAGFQIVIDFLNGLADSIEKNRGELAAAGLNLLDAIFGGVISFATDTVMPWFTALPSTILGWIGNVIETLAQKGKDLILGLFSGILNIWDYVKTWIENAPSRILSAIGDLTETLLEAGKDVMRGFWDGLKAIWNEVKGWLESLTSWIPDWKGPPDRDKVLLYENGTLIMGGLLNGMKSGWDDTRSWLSGLNPADDIQMDTKDLSSRLTSMIRQITDEMQNMSEFDGPVITPVLDLSVVQRDAKVLNSLMKTNQIYSVASAIASTPTDTMYDKANAGSADVKFEQNIYAPTQLSAGDIYRQTRNQIIIAKEELDVR